MAEPDPLLRRVERNGMIACAAMAAAAWTLAGWNVAAPAGVFGGGALAWVSYSGIKGGVDVLTGVSSGGGSRRAGMAAGLVKVFTRYAILAVAAYVIMARLRLPPVAVCAGASSLVVAVMVEAVRPRRG